MTGPQDRPDPTLRVVRGRPTAEDLAALVAVVAGLASSTGRDPAPSPVRGAWSDPSRAVRPPVHATAGGWRRSGLPR
ncbi:MAG TPA: acyl-CoA carboxylase subunit epsilon [Mycobacteriales bacterium]|nr:acyl-CoA carboxylase subunit epsilon [Mycobacteriales bacterium]